MDPKLSALRELLRDPSANYTAVAVAIAALVLFVLIIILALIAAIMPKRRAVASGTTENSHGHAASAAALVAIVVLAGVIGASALWYQQTSKNVFCTESCHSMKTATISWMRSPHSRVNCIGCHEDSSLKSVPRNAAYRMYYLYREYVSQSVSVPLAVPAARCLSCHEQVLDARLTARNGDSFTHRETLVDGASCRSCHRSQGHEPARK